MKTLNRIRKTLMALSCLTVTLLFSTPAHSNSLTYDNARNLVYAGFSGTVAVLDVNDPTNPTLVSDSIRTQGIVTDLFYDEGSKRLYVAANEGDLEIWDLQNTTSPQLISNTKVYYFGSETPVISVAVKGNIAFVSTAWGYMHRLDVSDPSNPIDLGFDGRGGNPSRELSLADDGSLLLAGPNTIHFQLDNDGNILSSVGGFHNFSSQIFRNSGTTYSSRSNILKISGANFVDTGNNINDIFADNSLVFIAAANGGLRIWDVSDKNAPFVIGTDASQFASSVIVNNNLAYVAFGKTVRIVDVSAPSNPSVVGLFDAEGAPVSNINPIANASTAQSIISGDNVSLNGNNSNDSDGTIVGYSWVQISGTPVVLSNANTATPSFIALYDLDQTRLVQQLNFELTVTDNDGSTGSDTVQINVSKSANGDGVIGGGDNNVAPVADAGPALSVRSRQRRIKLDGRGSYDSDGSIVTYSWKQISGKNVRLRRSGSSIARFRAPRVKGSAIQLVFELTVTDNQGASSSSRVNVTVSR